MDHANVGKYAKDRICVFTLGWIHSFFGCQLSGMLTAFSVANPDEPLEATAAAVCVMGLAGEIAYERLSEGEGNSTYRNKIIDAIYNMDGDELEKGARYEIRQGRFAALCSDR